MIKTATFKVGDGYFTRKIYYLPDRPGMIDDSLTVAHKAIADEYDIDLDDIELVDLS